MTGIFDLTEYTGAIDVDAQLLVDCPSRSPRSQRLILSEYAKKSETLENKILGRAGQQSAAYVSQLRVGQDASDMLWLASKTATWTPGAISSATAVTLAVAVAGAAVGDTVSCSALSDHDGCILTGRVTSADVVTLRFYNPTGSTITLTSLSVALIVSRFA